MQIGSEFSWIVDGFTPNTIPMGRLAEYMQEFAKLLGHEASVHFVRVEKGSLKLVSRAEAPGAAGKVSARIARIRSGDAPQDALRAQDALNEMLAEDNTTARLTRGSATIIRFPGLLQKQHESIELHDVGSLVGRLYMLSEVKDYFHARLRLSEGGMIQCRINSDMARKLREHLFENIRVFGRGVWRRESAGAWRVMEFEISDVAKITRGGLRAEIEQLRKLDIRWPEDPIGEISRLNDEGDPVH